MKTTATIAILAANAIVAIGAYVALRPRRECPACSRRIPARAKRCPKCGADIAAVEARSTRSDLKARQR